MISILGAVRIYISKTNDNINVTKKIVYHVTASDALTYSRTANIASRYRHTAIFAPVIFYAATVPT